MSGWEYTDTLIEGARRQSARVRSLMPVCAVDGQLVHAWLEFSHHALSGPRARIALDHAVFDPRRSRELRVGTGTGQPWLQRASIAPDGALGLREVRELWARVRGAGLLTLRLPVQGQRLPVATCDLASLDRSRLPWDDTRLAKRLMHEQTLRAQADS